MFPKSSFVLSLRQCAMLRDANPDSFAGIYIVCSYTVLRYGIDSFSRLFNAVFKVLKALHNAFPLFCGYLSTSFILSFQPLRLWHFDESPLCSNSLSCIGFDIISSKKGGYLLKGNPKHFSATVFILHLTLWQTG